MPYTDHWGRFWSADRYFDAGGAVELPKRYFARAFDLGLFQTARTGDFSYHLPLSPGVYELRLHFIETAFGPTTAAGGGEYSRTFDVAANGRPLLTGFDIYSDAGGTDIADTRVFKDISPGPGGVLQLTFHSGRASALVNAIEIVASEPHKLTPIRIVCQSNFVTDNAGNVWMPDAYVAGGQVASHAVQVSGGPDPQLYASERFGHFDYALPVDSGVYRLSLYFAEEYWGAGNQGGTSGSRVFDVFSNGLALLRNFDPLKEAAPGRAVVKTFHGLTPDAQGKLKLSFVPVHDYASLYALEVVDESK